MKVDEPTNLLSELLQVAGAEPQRPWAEVMALASKVLGGPALWFFEDTGASRLIASSVTKTPPATAMRLVEGRWILAVGAPVDENIARAALYGLVLRARGDELLRVTNEAREAHAALRDLGFEGICISRDGVLIEVNQALADLYGYSREEMVGMHMSRLIAPEVLPRVVELVKAGYEAPYETAALRQDGTIIPLEARGKEIIYQGKPARVASFRDLRATKAAAAALEEARRDAERANQQKTVFLGNISHELRTPMNGVLGVAQLLMRERLPPDAHGLAQELNTSASHMVDLLDDLLDLTRIEEGRLDLRERPFEVKALIEGVLRSLRSVHPGVTLEVSIDDAVEGWWRGDDRRIRQVVLNLLDNAVKYTPRGSIDVRVSRSDDELHFAVRDTGIGISEQALPRLFHRFVRGETEGEDAYGGTGLGLHISHELADRMGGSLMVQSTEGVGSTFVLALPLTVSDEPKEPEPDEVPKTAPLTILVAEDDPVSQIVVRRLLQSLGHAVTVVPSGADVLTAVEESTFDVVLMDVQMPVLGGLDATAELRARGRDLPIVALTAHAMKPDLEKCLEAGMDAWITKPVELPRLEAVLAEVTRGDRSARRGSSSSISRLF